MQNIDYVKFSNSSKDLLNKIKKNINVEHWNGILRIAFCLAIANDIKNNKNNLREVASVSIDWKTFAGSYDMFYTAIIKQLMKKQSTDNTSVLVKQFIEFGISELSKSKDINGVIKKIIS